MSELKLNYSPEFVKLLNKTGGSILLSCYQAGQILVLSAPNNVLTLTPIAYNKPMGIAVSSDGKKLGIATKDQLHIYTANDGLAQEANLADKKYKTIYFPRITYHTGELDIHDVHFVNSSTILGVNTAFSCLCTFDSNHNFIPHWKPNFITSLTPEDKCHLNGMAMIGDQPAFVTALGHADIAYSWRQKITTSGVLIDVKSNEIISSQLSMPHSPRIFEDYIYLLESAKGHLVKIHKLTHEKSIVCSLQGVVRGLFIKDNLAFIGISKIREKSMTAVSLPSNTKTEAAGICIVDLVSGYVLAKLDFNNFIEEIYDLQFLPEKDNVGIFGLYDKRHKAGISTPNNVFWRKPED